MCEAIPSCYTDDKTPYTAAKEACREAGRFLADNPEANWEELEKHLIAKHKWAVPERLKELVENTLHWLEEEGEPPESLEEYRKILSLLPK